MAAIRNTCVARAHITTAGGSGTYFVPANTALILKSVYVQTDATNTGVGSVYMHSGDTGVNVTIARLDPTSNVYLGWQGWTVMNAGDELVITFPGVAFAYWVAGALLPYAPGF